MESQPSEIHQGFLETQGHSAHSLISLGPVTYPSGASVSSAIMRTETSPVVLIWGVRFLERRFLL